MLNTKTVLDFEEKHDHLILRPPLPLIRGCLPALNLMMAKHPVPVLATLGGLLGFQVLLDSLFFSAICSLLQSLLKSGVLCLSFRIIEIDHLGQI